MEDNRIHTPLPPTHLPTHLYYLQAVRRRGLLVQTWPFLGCPHRPHLYPPRLSPPPLPVEEWVGGWVGGWVKARDEVRVASQLYGEVGDWVGGWVGGWVPTFAVLLLLLILPVAFGLGLGGVPGAGDQHPFLEACQGGWVGGWMGRCRDRVGWDAGVHTVVVAAAVVASASSSSAAAA